MDNLKKQHERAAGERFIGAYNAKMGCNYVLKSEGERPDLTYEHQDRGLLGVEVATVYYDQADARVVWEVARGNSSLHRWGGVNPDEKLLSFINEQIAGKCEKFSQLTLSFPCLLLCDGKPRITDRLEVENRILPGITMPEDVPFAEIWLGLDLPHTSRCAGDYRIWRLHPKL